jgi:protein phosphatase
LRVGRLTDIGQLRQLNEDSLLTLEAGYVHRSASRPLGLYVVADGAGGHAAGDVASGIVVRTLAQHVSKTLFSHPLDEVVPGAIDVPDWLRQAAQLCNEAVHQQRNTSHTDMGTTLVMAVVIAGEAFIAHVGDSRAYLINSESIRQITTDHSWVQRMVETGQITPEEARTHERRNVIYKMIGDRPKIDPDINHLVLSSGDRLLLCSDGLSGAVEDIDIHRIVVSSNSPQEACQRLIDAANRAGGPDNISVVIVRFERIGEEL